MYKSRLFIVALLFLESILIFGIVSLFPSIVSSFVKEKEAKDRLSIVSQIVSTEEQKNIRESVSEVNKKIALLEAKDPRTVLLSEAIEKIIARAGEGIRVTAFFFDKTFSASGEVLAVSGIARDRRTLLAFVDEVRLEESFMSVDLPVSNFVRSADIPFSISVTLYNNAGN